MAKSLQLNGMIHSKYETESAFAQSMGWSRQRLWKLTTGRRVPDLFDLATMARALECSIGDLAHIFLAMKSTTVDKKEN